MIEALIGVVQAVYTFIVTNLGLKADSADSSGTVLARLKHIIDVQLPNYNTNVLYGRAQASGTLVVSADTSRTNNTSSYVKLKEIAIGISGTVRVSFKVTDTGSGTSEGDLRLNGVSVGTGSTSSSATYTFDIAVDKGDIFTLWGKITSSTTCALSEFRISYDVVTTPFVVITD